MEKLTLIKVGGKIVEEEETLRNLLNDFSQVEGYKVLVHGGGRSATKLALLYHPTLNPKYVALKTPLTLPLALNAKVYPNKDVPLDINKISAQL